MNICYILKDRATATNDIFSFSIEDNGKFLHLNNTTLLSDMYTLTHEKNPFVKARTKLSKSCLRMES